MKLTLITLLSLIIGLFLGYSALKTAESLARISLVKTESVLETTP